MTHDEKNHMKSLSKSDAKIFSFWLLCSALAGAFCTVLSARFSRVLLWPFNRALEMFSPYHAQDGPFRTFSPGVGWSVLAHFTAIAGVVLLPLFYMSSMPHRIAAWIEGMSANTLLTWLLAIFLLLILLLSILAIFPKGMM